MCWASKHVTSGDSVNDRIIAIKINCQPLLRNHIQVYDPTNQSSEVEINKFYGNVEEAIEKVETSTDNIRNVVGKYGIGNKKKWSEALINFCIEQQLAIANALFQQHIGRLYAQQSTDTNYQNQIDYVIINVSKYCMS